MALSGVGDQWITVLIKDASNPDYQRVPITGIIAFHQFSRNYRVYMVTDKLSGSFGGQELWSRCQRSPLETRRSGLLLIAWF